MGITVAHELGEMNNQAFRELDYSIMDLSSRVHKELGRLHDEKVYQNHLRQLLQREGIGVSAEVRISVEYGGFSKSYFADLLVAGSAVYELKAAEAISGRHRAQVINYLMLCGLQHGQIINFRPASVETEFVTTSLREHDRYDYSIDDSNWQGTDQHSRWLREMVEILVREWGCFLSVELYAEAVTHFAGGPDRVITPVEIYSPTDHLGYDRFHLLNATTAFEFTGKKNTRGIVGHLQKKLECTSLRKLHWVNFSGREIMFNTLQNTAGNRREDMA